MVCGKSLSQPVTAPQAYALALEHHQAGRLREAEALYRQVLAAQPDHAEAWHHLGIIAHQMGRHDLALQWIQQALTLNPGNAFAHFNLAEASAAAGQSGEAIASFRRALELKPDYFEACLNLGRVLRQSGCLDEAIAANHRAIELKPSYPGAYYNLGNALLEGRRFSEAVIAYRWAIELKPDFFEAYNNLGNALRENGQLDEAVAAYRRAVEFKPDWPEAHNNLGNGFREQGRFDEAIAAYRRAVALKPEHPEARNNLGTVLVEQGWLDEAVVTYRRALDLKPDCLEAYNNLGVVLTKLGLLDDALAAYRRALELRPDYQEARNNLGGALLGMGQLDEAIGEFREVLRLDPACAWVRSNLIYALHFHPGCDERAITREQACWNRQSSDPLRRLFQPYANSRQPDRLLRIGYVSPYFRDHVVGRNLWPLFQYHDPQAFEVFCYADVLKADETTKHFRQRADQWRDTAGLSDGALARLIREDAVDILVDLTLHMEGNRLPMFAHRPAPLQASFAGYPASTGLDAIRYRIGDGYLESEMGDGRPKIGIELPSVERSLLIESFWCYDPCEGDLSPNDLPAQKNGCVTFASLNNFCKVNDPLLRLWAKVLNKVENSRLILLSGQGSHRRRTLEILAQEGVAAERVEFVELRPRRSYLEQYHRVDIVLDPFPYNGHTTSLDALWMGVPVVTLVGERSVSRAGLSQLSNVGFPELAAFSEDDYVRIATQLAGDFPRMSELRSSLRYRMENSVLMDAPRFTRDIEAAYRGMWRQWCGEDSSLPP